jgi:hypothetical protein
MMVAEMVAGTAEGTAATRAQQAKGRSVQGPGRAQIAAGVPLFVQDDAEKRIVDSQAALFEFARQL